MADHLADPDSTSSRRGVPPGMPRWVKVTVAVVGILLILFVVLKLSGLAGAHGPGRHLGLDTAWQATGQRASSAVGLA